MKGREWVDRADALAAAQAEREADNCRTNSARIMEVLDRTVRWLDRGDYHNPEADMLRELLADLSDPAPR